ncbi:hypothetical protein GE09DRAFT_1048395 [Coniochaeta sp. 2T2.1]|nr:hypothetical protein GE09DRAFT_1048395 [Coniochaeta sp. 2T2.1]
MGDFDEHFITQLRQQSWSLYSVGMFIILLRITPRLKRLGPPNLQPDDFLMLLVAALYTTLVVCLNVTARGGGSNLYPPHLEGTFSPTEIRERVYGSKIVVVSEQAMLNVVYAVKSCMLVMYTRLTLGLTTQKLVRWLGVYVFCGWVASQMAFFTACTPFENYWAMPLPEGREQCATLSHYSIVQAVFNISSDAAMLSVPLPLIFRTTMPVKQKVVLSVIFGMGMFVIIAALLTKVFNLSDVWDPRYMLWYVREASVAVYVSNLPMVWPLVREWAPWLRSWAPGSSGSRSRGRRETGRGGGVGGAGGWTKTGSRGGTVEGRVTGPGQGRTRGRRVNSLGSLDSAFDLDVGVGGDAEKGEQRVGGKYRGDNDGESTEQIVGTEEVEVDSSTREGSHDSIGVALTKMGGIQVRRTVEVLEERPANGRRDVGDKGDYSVDVEVAKGGYEWERRRMECEVDRERGHL